MNSSKVAIIALFFGATEALHLRTIFDEIANDGFAETEADLNLESDPICSSAGCVQYTHPKAKGDGGNGPLYKIAPDGADPEMEATQKSIAIAESLYRHKWDFGTARSRALKKYHNVAKDTNYNFAPKLDSEIVDAQTNLRVTEKRLNHHWVY